jgi:hypothetical protein
MQFHFPDQLCNKIKLHLLVHLVDTFSLGLFVNMWQNLWESKQSGTGKLSKTNHHAPSGYHCTQIQWQRVWHWCFKWYVQHIFQRLIYHWLWCFTLCWNLQDDPKNHSKAMGIWMTLEGQYVANEFGQDYNRVDWITDNHLHLGKDNHWFRAHLYMGWKKYDLKNRNVL